jgi:IS5 family transposase
LGQLATRIAKSASGRAESPFYGFKLHAAVCARTELPVAWDVRTARDAEAPLVPELLDAMGVNGFHPETMIADKGYDVGPVYEACEARGIRPIIPLRLTGKVVAGEHLPPSCEHGVWTFAGADERRGAAKYRCPSGECSPASVWLKADRLHTLIPRESRRWKALYRRRGAVERGFGRLKNEWGLLPLRVRGLDKVRLHADLTILGQLAVALAKARAVPLAA